MINEKKSVQVFISKDFDMRLKQHMLDLELIGDHTTKAELIELLAEVGLRYNCGDILTAKVQK
jgi:hypothetical protein